MAGARSSLSSPRHLIGASKSIAVKFLRPNFSEFPITFRSSANYHRHRRRRFSTCFDAKLTCPVVSEGPSCIFVGPIETASQETLEALYRQARDAYYSGNPLIVDDMFDRVELKLRWYGSKYVVKYPRCSLRRQSTYADAQEDPSQVFALASVWFLILAFGGCVCLLPILYTAGLAYQDTFNSDTFDIGRPASMEFLATLNYVLFMLLGSVIGCPIASASVSICLTIIISARALQRLWRNDLVALKGACPNCGEEVFAFVKSDESNGSPHRANCHVCDCMLEFRTKTETISKLGRRWVHGRVYLISERRSRQRQIRS